MAERGEGDGRGPGKLSSIEAWPWPIKDGPWYIRADGEAPETATPALLNGIRDLLREEIKTRLANAGQPGIGEARSQKIKISDAGGGIFLELEINNSVPYGYGEAEILRFCNRLDAENVLVTRVNLLPAGALLEYGKGGPRTDTGVFYIRTFAERTVSGSSDVYRSSDLEGVSLNGDFLIEFLRAQRGQFALDGFDEWMEELETVGAQGKTAAAKKDRNLERAQKLVASQKKALQATEKLLRGAGTDHFRLIAKIEDLKFTKHIMIFIIVALTAIIALGVISPQGCQSAHDVFAGKRGDNGAEKKNGGPGRARDGKNN